MAGGLETGVGYTLDGATHNNPQENVNLPLPFPDALQEFRVATSGLSAQNGFKSAAAVNAVTKSGTNRFSGNAFEFLRHHRFNATSPFASIGPDGKRRDDGLKRNQFGGTLGGPILRDRLFFFGAYQATPIRRSPPSNIAYVPTPAMLAGDFTAFTSPACNGGRQVALRAPYVNNQINPALFSPAAVNLAKRLPSTTDPCGQITYDAPADADEAQTLARIDYQTGTKHSFFGRYLLTHFTEKPGYAGGTDNILKTSAKGSDMSSHSTTFGATTVLSSSMVNALRVAVNIGKVDVFQTPFFSPKDIGANLYAYVPGYMTVNVTGGFLTYDTNTAKALFLNDTYQLAEDLTVVRGNHQFGFGANLNYFEGDLTSTSRANGNWIFNGSATGLGLADLLVGRVTSVEHGGPNKVLVNNWHMGLYAQDSWRASSRVTVNVGARWEPYFGQNVVNNAIAIFKMENFEQVIKSQVFLNAPAGLIYPGDEGFPPGQTGLEVQWWNLAPRLGVAWDVHGDGRLAVRSSYSMGYDFMSGEYHNINSSAPPFGNRSTLVDPPGLLDDPYRSVGGDPHPIVTGPTTPYVPFGGFGTMDPGINSPRVQSWNVTVEQQLGSQWGVSASYLGSYSDRLWAPISINPGIYMGIGPCTLRNGVTYPVCSTNANLNFRRVLYQQNPTEAAFIGGLDLHTDVGYQNYRGLKLSAQRRSINRREPQWQLHLVALLRHRDDHSLHPDQRRPRGSEQSGLRRRLLRPGSETPGDADRRIRDAGTGQCRGARARLALAALGDPDRAVGQPAQHSERHRQCVHRYRQPAPQPGQRRLLPGRADADELLQPRGIRAAGAGHAGQPSPQCRGGSGLLECQPGRVEADQRHRHAAVGSPHRDVQPLQPFQLGQSGS